MPRRSLFVLCVVLLGTPFSPAADPMEQELPESLAPYFTPPAEFAGKMGEYRSPLRFDDGTEVTDAAGWRRRREEILATWHGLMGQWPPLIDRPKVEVLSTDRQPGFTRQQVRIQVAPDRSTDDAYLLIPDGEGPFPAVLVVFYDGRTGAGLNPPDGKPYVLDFARQLAQRGFVTLSLGAEPGLYYPSPEKCQLQSLSFHAYMAANCCNALAAMPEVDPERIGIVGHSYGAKWAMFASCLYDKFAAAAWSDGGVVFDEQRSNVNYWEPWYLGFEPGREQRPRGVVTESNPRTGAYKQMIEQGRDLHELHALMAPRPFLVSGGSEDPPQRWEALNHTVAVNRLLGCEHRVGMTNRPTHNPTEESNRHIVAFFEYFLKGK